MTKSRPGAVRIVSFGYGHGDAPDARGTVVAVGCAGVRHRVVDRTKES